MGVELVIQDPGSPEPSTLHEAILDACRDSTGGGGAFAFATKEGAELLLNDPVFSAMTDVGAFHLIVGIDEITNERALKFLDETSQEQDGLSVNAFYHTRNSSLFHPKFCWFRKDNGGTLLVGSGNLTARAFRKNWEAFTLSELDSGFIAQIETQWREWLELNQSNLRDLSHDEVIEKAKENKRQPRKPRGGSSSKEEKPENLLNLPVLVAEIPKGSTRWNQANFDLDNFRNFFGAEPGNTRHRILLQHVDSEGGIETLENRPSVAVKSKNYRFELEAASGRSYPKTGRPVGIFVKIAPRTFRYRLLFPDDFGYETIDTFLNKTWNGRGDRMRRVRTNVETLIGVWPESPLWEAGLDLVE